MTGSTGELWDQRGLRRGRDGVCHLRRPCLARLVRWGAAVRPGTRVPVVRSSGGPGRSARRGRGTGVGVARGLGAQRPVRRGIDGHGHRVSQRTERRISRGLDVAISDIHVQGDARAMATLPGGALSAGRAAGGRHRGYRWERRGRNLIQARMATATSSHGENNTC